MSVVTLPSIRRLVLADPGYTLIDGDLQRADAQFVAWETGEAELKHIYQTGFDIYTGEAEWLYGPASNAADRQDRRQRMKSVIHAANYGGKERTLAATAGVTIARMGEWLHKRWYGRFPGLQRWHRQVEQRLRFERQIHNIWGFRRFYFDDIDKVLPQALAWIGQSSVAVVINKAMIAIRQDVAGVQILLQVHDSLVMQCESHVVATTIPLILEKMRVIVPYPDPLIIPVSVKTSNKSWGDVHPWKAAA